MRTYSKGNEFIDRLIERVLDDKKYKTFEDILWTNQDGEILKDIRSNISYAFKQNLFLIHTLLT